MPAPVCFVLTPFGNKTGRNGLTVDFDAVYTEIIEPAVGAAGLNCLRDDLEASDRVIRARMSERLALATAAVVDITRADSAILYNLGIREGLRPATTVLLSAEGTRQSDDGLPAGVSYRVTADGRPVGGQALAATLRERLTAARHPSATSLFALLERFHGIQHVKTDVFRDRVSYAPGQKEALAAARRAGLAAVSAFEAQLGDIGGVEAALLVDLLLSYRSVQGWQQMIELGGRMPPLLNATLLVQEQLALALNRAGRDGEAEATLRALLETRGPSSETYALLGRVYKDRYERARDRGDTLAAHGELDRAIDAYVKGFESDWRDAYPGINAVSLMELREPPDPRQPELVTLVTYAVKRHVAGRQPDYWDNATFLELAILSRNGSAVLGALKACLTTVRESWEPETTLRTIRRIDLARRDRGEARPGWMDAVLEGLQRAAA